MTSIYGAVDGSHLFDLVNYAIFEAPESCLVHVSDLSPARGRILPSMVNTPVFTDHEDINSTFREEPPKIVTFYDNFGRSCSKGDPGWNWPGAWETTEFTTTVHLGCPGIS